MANESTYAALSDLRAAAILHQEIDRLLHDPTDLRQAMLFKPFDGVGSAALKVGQVNGADAMAAPGEVTQAANTALVDSSYSLTVAHYTLVREITDLAQITAPDGGLNIEYLAKLMVDSAGLTITDMACALFPSLSASVGTSGVNLSVDDIYNAQFQLQSQAVPSGDIWCVLGEQQWNDFQSSLRGEGGAIQFHPATAEMLAIKGSGFCGQWNGINFIKSDSVTASGGNLRGALFDRGCFAYTEAPVGKMQATGAPAVLADSRLYVETMRKADYGSTLVVGHYFPAVIEAEDLRGVAIVTDE